MDKKIVVPKIKLNLIDRAVGFFNPVRGMQRAKARMGLSFLHQGGYVGGSTTRRSLRGWPTSDNDADASLIPDLQLLRQRSRDLYINTPLANGGLKRINTNSIGPGLRLQTQINRDVLDISDREADDWETNVEARFNFWADSKDSDAARELNFHQQQGLVVLSALMSGDCFTLMPRIRRPGLDNDLRIAVFEGDFVSNPQNNLDSNTLAGGIQTGKWGEPEIYWFSKLHPGGFQPHINEWFPIRAFGRRSGRKNVLHLKIKERPGQRRGAPLLAPVIESLKQLTRYSESELMAAVVTSFFTVFIKSDSADGDPLEEGIHEDVRISDPANNKIDEKVYEMGNGNIIGLAENESIEQADPKRPNAGFDNFFMSVTKQIGASIEVPFEQLTLHFSASYSAARGALLEAWKFYMKIRSWAATDFTQPVYEAWLNEEILFGRIKAPGFMEDNFKRWAWSRAKWVGPGQGQIDPVKESKATHQKIVDNQTTREDEFISRTGGDWRAAMRRKRREEEFMDDLNLQQEKPQAADGTVEPPEPPPEVPET